MPQGVGELALTVLVIIVILAVLAIWVFLRKDIAKWVTDHFDALKKTDTSYDGPGGGADEQPTGEIDGGYLFVPSDYFLVK